MDNTLLEVEGYRDLARDPETKAIINTNREAYNNAIANYKRARAEKERIDSMEDDINNIKNDISDIKQLMVELINKGN